MTIWEALQAIKKGGKAKRKGWKKQYIEMVSEISYRRADGEMVEPLEGAFNKQSIVLVTNSVIQIGWSASKADLLATDWITG